MDYPMENLGFGPSVSYSNHNKNKISSFKENSILRYHEEDESNMIMIVT